MGTSFFHLNIKFMNGVWSTSGIFLIKQAEKTSVVLEEDSPQPGKPEILINVL